MSDKPKSDDEIDLSYDDVAAYKCPDCGHRVVLSVGDPYVGYGVRCAECETRMEIIKRR